MRHLRWVPPGEWPQEEDPETSGIRDVPVRGGMVLGMVLLGEHPDGGWLFDVHREREGLPGFKISEGVHRYKNLRSRDKVVAWRQAVHRGSNLRSDVLSDLGRTDPGGPPQSPLGRGRLRDVEHREVDPEEMIQAARDRGDAVRIRVPLREVRDEDIVEGEPEHGARWAGEAVPNA